MSKVHLFLTGIAHCSTATALFYNYTSVFEVAVNAWSCNEVLRFVWKFIVWLTACSFMH